MICRYWHQNLLQELLGDRIQKFFPKHYFRSNENRISIKWRHDIKGKNGKFALTEAIVVQEPSLIQQLQDVQPAQEPMEVEADIAVDAE